MEHFETDEQRAEALIDWLKAHGMIIFLGVIIGLGSFGGYHYWQTQKLSNLQAAGDAYTNFVKNLPKSVTDGKALEQTVNESLARIAEASKESGFISLAKLKAAGEFANAKNFDAAIAQYQVLMNSEKDPVLKALISYRLARVQFEKGDFAAAFTTSNNIQESAFNTLIFELHGDIFVKQNKLEDAKNAYIQAKNYGSKSMFLFDKMSQLGIDIAALPNIKLEDVTNINK